MKLYIKQKVFSWADKFSIFDETGNAVFFASGEVFSFGKKLHICDPSGTEFAFIHQKVFSFLPRYFIARGGSDIAEVVKKFTLFRSQYTVDAFGWFIQGNFTDHNYSITSGRGTVAVISRKWFTWGDTYEIDIVPGEDVINVLSVVLIIDAVISAQRAAASS